MQHLDVFAQVTDQAAGKDAWWQVAAGILAIPTAVLGLVYTFHLMKKSRLESRKIELEIEEKEVALQNIKAGTQPATGSTTEERFTELVAQPLLAGRRVQEILLKFVMLFLILLAWRIVDQLFGLVRNVVGLGLGLAYSGLGEDPPAYVEIPLIVIMTLVREIPTLAFYLVLVGVGGPIFIAILRHFEIKPPRLLAPFERPSRKTYVFTGLVVLVLAYFDALGVFGTGGL